jgi:ribosomal protein S8
MFTQINKIKSLLSKLIVASICYKKMLRIKQTKTSTDFLNLLQKKGFIYGYTKTVVSSGYYMVFLKYSDGNNLLLTNVTLLHKSIIYKNMNFFEKNSLYLVITKKCYYLGVISKKKKISGYIIAKF